MKRRLTRIAPWQAAKVSALLYFLIGLVISIPFGLLALVLPPPPEANGLGVGLFFVLPFMYAVAGLVFVPLMCWFYNLIARVVGGIEVSVEEDVSDKQKPVGSPAGASAA